MVSIGVGLRAAVLPRSLHVTFSETSLGPSLGNDPLSKYMAARCRLRELVAIPAQPWGILGRPEPRMPVARGNSSCLPDSASNLRVGCYRRLASTRDPAGTAFELGRCREPVVHVWRLQAPQNQM